MGRTGRRHGWSSLGGAGVAAWLALGGGAVAAQPDPRAPRLAAPEFELARLAAPIAIDGVLDEAAWSAATQVPLVFEVEPGDNAPAPIETDCRIGFDAERLYLGCRATDPDPERIRAFLTGRDRTGVQDEVGLVLDPFGDARRAFLFSVTALGVQRDERFDQESDSWDPGWDALWRSAARLDAGGFAVEAAIPFASFRFDAGATAPPWRFWIFRFWPRSAGVVVRSMPRDRSNACQLCQANRLSGVRDIEPGRNLDLAPTVTSNRSDRVNDTGRLAAGEVESEAGLDLRWSPTSALSVNAALNPDFSQIEADVAQLDVNPRFALLYPEKRPFFLEGADQFTTPLEIFVSRSIVDPSFGLKATGRAGPFELGALVARDETPALLVPGAEESTTALLDRAVSTSAARLRRSVTAKATLGAIALARRGGDYDHRLLGLDAVVRPIPEITVRAQALGSHTRYPFDAGGANRQTQERLDGRAFELDASYESRDWLGGLALRGRSPGFRADAGFVPQVDVRGAHLRLTRLIWGEGDDHLTQIGLYGELFHDQRWQGGLLAEGGFAEIWIDGPLQSGAWIQPWYRRDRFAGRLFEQEFVRAGCRIRPSAAFAGELSLTWGDAIDFAAVLPADRVRVAGSVELRLGRRVELTLRETYERLERRGAVVVTGALSELRAAYHLDARASLRALAQWVEIEHAPGPPGAPASTSERELRTELLFAYELDPQRVLYLGSEERQVGGVDELAGRFPTAPVERTYFLKVGYGWRP